MKNIIVKAKKETLKLQIQDTTTMEQLIELIGKELKTNQDQFIVKYNGKNIKNAQNTVSELARGNKSLYISVIDKPIIPVPVIRKLCTTGCGFYGDHLTQDMCSKCYLTSNAEKAPETSVIENVNPPISVVAVINQTNHSKCWKCNKNVGLLGFKCRCLYTFCAMHRCSPEHNCTFDYMTHERKRLKLQLEGGKCENFKINKI